MYQNATKIYDIVNFDEQFSYVYGKKIAPFKCISISIKSTKQNYIVQSIKKSTMIILKFFQTECIIRQGLIYP